MPKPRFVLAVLAAFGLSAASSRGQALADRVPSDAIIYAGWTGTDSLGAVYNASHLKTFLDALKLPALAGDRISQFLDPQAIAANGPAAKTPADIQFAKDFVAAVSHNPTAVYFGPFDTTGPQLEARAALISKMGTEPAKALAEQCNAAMKRDPNDDGKSHALAIGEYFVISGKNLDLTEQLAAKPPADSLATNNAFKKTLARLGTEAGGTALVGYVDGQSLVQEVSAVIEKNKDPQALRALPAIIEGGGLSNLRQVAWAGGFDAASGGGAAGAGGWHSDTFVGMGPHRVGMLAFMDNPPLTDTTFKLIPKAATMAGVFRFDGTRLLQDVNDAAGMIDENAPKQIETVITEVYKFTGIDMKRDLFPALGDEYVYYSLRDTGSNSIRGYTLINKLRDPIKAEKAISNSDNFINLLILQRNPESKNQFKPKRLPAPLQDVEAHEMVMERLTPSWAIHNGVFYFTLSEEALITAINQSTANDSLLDNAAFIAMRNRLGGSSASNGVVGVNVGGPQPICSFDFNDLPAAFPETFAIATRDLAALAAANPGAPAPFTLPPLRTLTPALTPALSIYWSDKDGYHGKSSAPFPLAEYLHPSQYLWVRILEDIQARNQPAASNPNNLP